MKSSIFSIYSYFRRKFINFCAYCNIYYTNFYVKRCALRPNKVVFVSYHGGGYGDNPKYIAEELLRQDKKWDLVWLCKDKSMQFPKGIRVVKYGSYRAQREIASAKYFIDNARSSPRPPKREGQVYLQVWHGGLAFKGVEKAVEDKLHPSYVAAAKRDGANSDGIVSACKLQSQDFIENFWLNEKAEILEYGLPRNDKLFDPVSIQNADNKIRSALDIDKETKIVLYMPTFRDNHRIDGYQLDFDAVLKAFTKRFGGKFVILVRLHPNVRDIDHIIPCSDNILNVTQYPDAQELYMIADYLITDYSSSVFDFALLRRPAFLFTLDLEKYIAERGLTDIFYRCPFPRASSNAALIQAIETFSEEEYSSDFEKFIEEWQPFDQGNAAKKVVDWMLSKQSPL